MRPKSTPRMSTYFHFWNSGPLIRAPVMDKIFTIFSNNPWYLYFCWNKGQATFCQHEKSNKYQIRFVCQSYIDFWKKKRRNFSFISNKNFFFISLEKMLKNRENSMIEHDELSFPRFSWISRIFIRWPRLELLQKSMWCSRKSKAWGCYEIFTLLVSWAPFYRQMLVIAALHWVKPVM